VGKLLPYESCQKDYYSKGKADLVLLHGIALVRIMPSGIIFVKHLSATQAGLSANCAHFSHNFADGQNANGNT
jgi:hypothetical protein